MAGKNPIKFTDTTFRDGHQSSLATRMRTEDMLDMAERMDNMGFWSMEVWGGATFDVTHRFLAEDPWERIRTLKKYIKKTPFMMLLRGQNLVGYRHYPDDVVEPFVKYAAECGINIFRVFDALNDMRNFETSFKAIQDCKKAGMDVHIQAAVCYSLTQRRMGGEVYTKEYYVDFAKRAVDMGADSFCVKDMAGMISPYDAYELIKTLKETINIPIELHTHYTSGQASMAYLKAIEAGVDIIDTCLSPFGLRTSQPAIEPILVSVEKTDRESPLDLATLIELVQDLEKVAPKYRDFLDTSKMAVIDTGVLLHQIPGGMYSNLVSQLKQADALDRILEVMHDLPQTRKELGYPPLVTPTSQIVGIQAVQNVLFGRYKMISGQVKDMAYGLYGKTPAPMDPEVQRLILKGYERGEEPITCRAADVLEPELEKAREATKGLAKNIGDVLIYALYPTTGLRFLKWKYGLEEIPEDVKPITMEHIKLEDEVINKIKQKNLFQKVKDYLERLDRPAPEKGESLRTFNVFVDGEYFEVEVECTSGAPVITAATPMAAARPAAAAPQPTAAPLKPAPAAAPAKPAPAAEVAPGEVPLRSPMPGMVISYSVNVGDQVKVGDPICILEAMKMQNNLPSPASGTVKAINYEPGASVGKDAILLVIAT
ncbi:MAG: pyruvate carboxylase subunit B [Deltaproteobacteria bacterium]|nr:pyruvate carboxylase subunit B [Deltaproteobacteria bacterium]